MRGARSRGQIHPLAERDLAALVDEALFLLGDPGPEEPADGEHGERHRDADGDEEEDVGEPELQRGSFLPGLLGSTAGQLLIIPCESPAAAVFAR